MYWIPLAAGEPIFSSFTIDILINYGDGSFSGIGVGAEPEATIME